MKTIWFFIIIFIFLAKGSLGTEPYLQVWCDEEALNLISDRLQQLGEKLDKIEEKISKENSNQKSPNMEETLTKTMTNIQMLVSLEKLTQSMKELHENQREMRNQIEQQILQSNEKLTIQINELNNLNKQQQQQKTTQNFNTSVKMAETSKISTIKVEPQIDNEFSEISIENLSNIDVGKFVEFRNFQVKAANHIEKHITIDNQNLFNKLKREMENSLKPLRETEIISSPLNNRNLLTIETHLIQDFRNELNGAIDKAIPRIADSCSKSLKIELQSNLRYTQYGLTKQDLQTEVHGLKDEMLGLKKSLSTLTDFFEPPFANCVDAIQSNGVSDVYRLYISQSGFKPFDAYCLEDPNNGTAWTIIQRRQDGKVDFYRNWDEYKKGFGNPHGDYWIGLEKIYTMTSKEPHELWIQLADQEGEKRQAHYSKFEIGNVREGYYLKNVGTYSGDAGDSLGFSSITRKFTTKDADNDDDTSRNCAIRFKGAWWYNNCNWSDLNAVYNNSQNGQGINWYRWHGYEYSLKYAHMAIRPIK